MKEPGSALSSGKSKQAESAHCSTAPWAWQGWSTVEMEFPIILRNPIKELAGPKIIGFP